MAVYTHNSRCITPLMTSNNTPLPWVVSASSIYSGSYLEYYCFNQSTTGIWKSSTANTGWIQIVGNNNTICKVFSYTIAAYGVNTAPKNWTYQYSIDGGVNWIIADTQAGITFSLNEMKTFTLATPVVLNAFNLDVTAVGTTGQTPEIVEFESIGYPLQNLIFCVGL